MRVEAMRPMMTWRLGSPWQLMASVITVAAPHVPTNAARAFFARLAPIFLRQGSRGDGVVSTTVVLSRSDYTC